MIFFRWTPSFLFFKSDNLALPLEILAGLTLLLAAFISPGALTAEMRLDFLQFCLIKL